MDAWTENTAFALPLSPGPDAHNPLYTSILAAKDKLLEPAAAAAESLDVTVAAFSAIIEGDMVAAEAAFAANAALVSALYPSASEGFSPLIFAVVFDQREIAESLLRIHDVDPDAPDTSAGYTPLMWAVALKSLATVQLLLEFGADHQISPKDNGVNAAALAENASADIFDYFKSHGLFGGAATAEAFTIHTFGESSDPVDDVAFKIRMQTLAADPPLEALDDEDMDEEALLSMDTQLVQTPNFNYQKPLPEQYIRFADRDIPSLLEYIFGLRSRSSAFQHDTKTPAAVVFQLLHYSHGKVDSRDLTEFLFECFLTRVRTVTHTTSGVFNMALAGNDPNDKSAGDIVLLSYWLLVTQFLHFYLTRADLYKHYPRFLHELVNLTQSLIATLSFSINARLNGLADDCMLDFTSLVDVSKVLYAKDWNLFKKQKKHPNSYDDIVDMLFPPSLTEMMKPSPLRYVQVLGALHYVLEIHLVDPLLRIQAFSQVFYCINATIFNRLIANSRHCSRVKAVQIRLNISALEDWLRSHNFHAHRPDVIGGVSALLGPGSGAESQNSSLLEDKADANDPHYLAFYYNSLYHVAKAHLSPTIELLQWLQIMSGISDEESLINTINDFDALNYYQLVKLTTKLYRYEVDETKMPKPLVQLLKRLTVEQGEAQISRSKLHYMTQSTFLLKEVYIYLNPNHVFGVALPNARELIQNYGAGLGGLKTLRAKKFQPSLPIGIMDDIDILLTRNKNDNYNDTYDYDESDTEQDSGEADAPAYAAGAPKEEKKAFKGDELFKQMQPPLSLAHKEWGVEEIESNPW